MASGRRFRLQQGLLRALDQCQARLYTAIARHAVLVMAALAICAVTAALVKDRTDTQAPPRSGPTSRHRQNPA